MRFLLPDLMEKRGLRTAYALERFSKGALPITTATRLVRAKDRPKRIDMDTLQVLCDMFGVGPEKLLEREKEPTPTPPAAPAVGKRGKRKHAA